MLSDDDNSVVASDELELSLSVLPDVDDSADSLLLSLVPSDDACVELS